MMMLRGRTVAVQGQLLPNPGMMGKTRQLEHCHPLCQELEVTAPHSLVGQEAEKQRTGPNDRLTITLESLASSGLYLPASPHDLKVPCLPKQPSAGDTVLKYTTLWSPFTFKSQWLLLSWQWEIRTAKSEAKELSQATTGRFLSYIRPLRTASPNGVVFRPRKAKFQISQAIWPCADQKGAVARISVESPTQRVS